jgi:arginine exporter protein ArgO
MFWSVLLIDAIFLNYLLVGPDIIKDDKDMASKYQKKKQAAAQVEASDKEQTYGIMVITVCKIPDPTLAYICTTVVNMIVQNIVSHTATCRLTLSHSEQCTC